MNSKFTDTPKNWLSLANIFCTLADIFCTLSVPHCTFYWLPLYPAAPYYTILLNSTVPHYWLPLYPTVRRCTEHWYALYPTVRYWIIFKSKTFSIIFSLIFILGCLIYSNALFMNFYWYWMLQSQICFICLLCQSLHHYHRNNFPYQQGYKIRLSLYWRYFKINCTATHIHNIKTFLNFIRFCWY